MKRFSSLILFFLFSLSCTRAQQQQIPVSDFCHSLTPSGRILETVDYYVWCVSPICDEQGRVHVFYSRWPSAYGMGGWIRACEIAHAVADTPEGPYEYVQTILSPRPGYWDATSCHNPHIQYIEGTYCLFYMGNSNGKTDTKRIGMATATDLNGPWTRPDQPLLEAGPEGSWDDHCATNPAFLKHPDGRYMLYYKSWNNMDYKQEDQGIRGNRKYGLALSDRLEGPYVRYEGNPVVDLSGHSNNCQVEDAYVWHQEGKFCMLMRDMGFVNHEAGLYFESEDGLEWGQPQIAWRGAREYLELPPAPSHLKRYGRFERPQLLMKEGKPAYLFTAMQGGKYMTASGFVFRIGEK